MLLPLASEGTRPEGLLPHQRLVTLPVTPLNVSVQHLPTPGLHTLLGWCPWLGDTLGPQQELWGPGDASPDQGESSSAAMASLAQNTLLGALNAAVSHWLC